MECPKCRHPMEKLALPEADAHRCTHCRGLWFGMRAFELLKDRAEEIDVGDPRLGEQCNRVDRNLLCPACDDGRLLIRMVDPVQPHIWFESCQNCFGRFYDAGEFVDFAEHGWRDFIKSFSVTERT
ncbi:MAG: zf-TFIIB domain-containing protein [Pseudoxanthomonas sp.]